MSKNRRHKHHHNKTPLKVRNKHSTNFLNKFFFWFIVYAIFIILLNAIFEKTSLYHAKIGFYLVMGYLLILCSRIVYSAFKRKSFSLKGIIVWGLFYSIAFGLTDFVLTKLPHIQINPSYDKYINLIIFSALFSLAVIFLRRMKIRGIKTRRGSLFSRAPSQVLSGIILIVFGILVFRFSHQIFVDWFNWYEGLAWSWLIGLGLIIAGILTLIAWWRNNVSMFTTRHKFKWN